MGRKERGRNEPDGVSVGRNEWPPFDFRMRTFSCLGLCSYNTFLSLQSIKQFSHPVKLKIALFTLDNSQKKIFLLIFFVSPNDPFAYSNWLKTLC